MCLGQKKCIGNVGVRIAMDFLFFLIRMYKQIEMNRGIR